MEDELDMETQLERELAAEQEELLEVEEEDEDDMGMNGRLDGDEDEDDEDRERESMVGNEKILAARPGLAKVRSLPANFIYNPPRERNINGENVVDYCRWFADCWVIGNYIEFKKLLFKNNSFLLFFFHFDM